MAERGGGAKKRERELKMVEGWAKIKPAAKYAGVSERTFRNWLKQGLKYARLPSGTILVRFKVIDDFLESFIVDGNETDKIVNEVLKNFKPK